MEYTDYLKEYMTGKARQYLDEHKPEDLPIEFVGLPKDRLILGLEDGATPILRKIEDDAIRASVERFASLIRYKEFARQKAKAEGNPT